MKLWCHCSPLSRCECYWLCELHPQLPGILPSEPEWRPGGQSWTHYCKAIWLPHTSCRHSNGHPPKERWHGNIARSWKEQANERENVKCVMSVYMTHRTYLLNVSIIGSIDELFQLSQAVGLCQSEDQLCFNIWLSGLLAGHLQKFYQVLPVSCTHQSTPIN